MSLQTETASEYLVVAARFADRGNVREALYHIDRAQDLLLRAQAVEVETPGIVVGESIRYRHLGNVLAEKARLANQR